MRLDGRLDVLAGGGGTDGGGASSQRGSRPRMGWSSRRYARRGWRARRGRSRHVRIPEDPVLAVGGERHRGLVGRLLLAVLGRGLVGVALLPAHAALGELLVELARVQQDQRRELDRAGRRVDRAAVAGLDQVRDQPAVVEVGVGQEDGVERRGVEVEREPVPDRLVRAPLEHPAVDEHLRLPGDEQMLRAGDGRRATEEVDLHRAHGDREPRRARTRLGRCGGSLAIGVAPRIDASAPASGRPPAAGRSSRLLRPARRQRDDPPGRPSSSNGSPAGVAAGRTSGLTLPSGTLPDGAVHGRGRRRHPGGVLSTSGKIASRATVTRTVGAGDGVTGSASGDGFRVDLQLRPPRLWVGVPMRRGRSPEPSAPAVDCDP